MEACELCGKTVSIWNSKAVKDGRICSECCSLLPKLVRNQSRNYRSADLHLILEDWTEHLKMRQDQFQTTAAFGKLYIDEMNGIFAVCDKQSQIPSSKDLYPALWISDFAITCNPKSATRTAVTCDVEFRCVMEEFGIDFKILIRKNVKCYCKPVDAKHVEWNEPGDLQLFRGLFRQMYQTAYEKYQRQGGFSPYKIDLFRAESLFMLSGDYSLEEIQKQRKRLMKAFHPDENDSDTTDYSQKINHAYKILKSAKEKL